MANALITDVATKLAKLRELEDETRQARDDVEAAVLAARDGGVSYTELAAATGEPASTMRFFAQRSQPYTREAQERFRRGVEGRRPGPHSNDGPGVSVTQAAEILGITPQGVHKRIKLGTVEAVRHGRYWRVLGLDEGGDGG